MKPLRNPLRVVDIEDRVLERIGTEMDVQSLVW